MAERLSQSRPSIKENAADLGIKLTEKVTLPAGLILAAVTAPFAPAASALFLGGSFYDYAGKEEAKAYKKKWEQERLARSAGLKEHTIFEAKSLPSRKKFALAA